MQKCFVQSITSQFHIMPAASILKMTAMSRHQDIRDTTPWMMAETRPLALLYISHRWKTLRHPDPGGRQLRALQVFINRLALVIESMLLDKKDRLSFVPSLTFEGALQAKE